MPLGAPKQINALRRFFLEPGGSKHRQYEALRAYFIEGRTAAQVANDFGYSIGSFHVLAHHFRREHNPVFFVAVRHGPQSQPKKSAARDLIVRLRKQNHSIYEISQLLKESGCALSATAVREVLKAEGFAALPRRRDDERPQPRGPRSVPVADARVCADAAFTPALAVCSVCRRTGAPAPRATRTLCPPAGFKDDPGRTRAAAAVALKLWPIERKPRDGLDSIRVWRCLPD